jgi:hypothetical protein
MAGVLSISEWIAYEYTAGDGMVVFDPEEEIEKSRARRAAAEGEEESAADGEPEGESEGEAAPADEGTDEKPSEQETPSVPGNPADGRDPEPDPKP